VFRLDTAAALAILCRVVAIFSFPPFRRIKSSLSWEAASAAGPGKQNDGSIPQAGALRNSACPDAFNISPKLALPAGPMRALSHKDAMKRS
jgi:hypothetical protein